MNLGQFIILSIFYLIGVYCLMHNICIQIYKKNITKLELLLQIVTIVSMTVLYGLGIIGCFCGIYNT